MIDIIDFRRLTRDRNKVQSVVFSDTGEAFASVDSAGHIVVFYIAKDRFVNVCSSVHPTATFITEKNQGMIFLGMADNSIHVYNLGKMTIQLKDKTIQFGII